VRLKLSYKTELTALLDEVRGQLLQAQISFDIWLGLSPMEDNDISDIVNSFKGFFIPTRAAHLDRFLIKVGNVLDSRHKKAPSLHRLLQMLSEDPKGRELNVAALQSRIDSQKGVATRVTRLRDKKAAHWEVGARPEDVYINEIRDLLTELEGIFNDIHRGAYPYETWSFRPRESSNTQTIMEFLQEYHALRPAVGIVARTAVRDPENPERYFISSDALEKLKQVLYPQRQQQNY